MNELTLTEYQAGTEKTAIYHVGVAEATHVKGSIEKWANLAYCALGLTGEAGEFAGEVKKAVRDDTGIITPRRKEILFKELGDVCWYISQCCTELGFKIEDVMEYNLVKLADRKERNVLTGSGDER